MAVLERISVSRDAFLCNALTLCVLNTGDIVCTYISTDARNALWFMAVRHISYTKPRGENKEYKAYRLWIYLNLQPNGISRIIEHVQNAMSIPSGLMFILTIVSRISFQRCANGFRNLSEKQRQMMSFDFQGQKVLLRGRV